MDSPLIISVNYDEVKKRNTLLESLDWTLHGLRNRY